MSYETEIPLFKEKDAKLVSHTRNPLTNDRELVVRWDVTSQNVMDTALSMLDTYGDVGTGLDGDVVANAGQLTAKKYVENPMASGKVYAGRWRVISVSPFPPGYPRKDSDGIYRTLRRGYMTSLDWTEARLLTDTQLPGNNVSVPGVTGAESADTARHLLARFYNVSPQHWNAIMASIPVGTSISIAALQSQDLGAEWHVSLARPQSADDGSYTIDVLLSNPMFVHSGYSDAGGDREVRRWTLEGVPRALGQTLIDQWELLGPGRSAMGSASAQGEYMTISLSLDSPTLQNLTIENIPTSCDTTLTLHFGWGYTKAEAGVFITSHSGALAANQSRKIRQVQTRGNGLFDIIIEEETVTFDAAKHILTFDLHIGAAVNNLTEWAYHVPLTMLATIKTAYAHGQVGYSSSFEVLRTDHCSFDYKGVILKKTAAIESETLNGGNPFKKLTLKKIINQIIALVTPVVSVRGVTVQHDVDVDQDGTRVIVERTETETNDTATAAVTTAGKIESVVINTGVEPSAVAAQTETVDGVSVETERLASKGNGLWEWARRKITRRSLTLTIADGVAYMRRTFFTGTMTRAEALTALPSAATAVGASIEASVRVDADGMAQVEKSTIQKSSFILPNIKSGTALEPETNRIGIQVNAEAIANGLATAPVRGEKRSFELVPEPDGTGKYKLQEVAGGQYIAPELLVESNGLIEIYEIRGRNVDAISDHDFVSGGASPTFGEMRHEINDRALSDFVRRTLKMAGNAATLQVTVSNKSYTEEDRQLKYADVSSRKRFYDSSGRLEKVKQYTSSYVYELIFTRAVNETTVRVYSLAKLDADATTTSATQDQSSQVRHDAQYNFWVKETTTITKAAAWSFANKGRNYAGFSESTETSPA